MRNENREITAADVAKLLMVTERHAESLLKECLIGGRQLRSGVWLTSRAAVERYQATANLGGGRSLSTSTAWGLLWELSGLHPSWLAPSTLARVRQQIASLTPEEIVRATSGRTRVHFYTLAPSSGIAWDSLIRTGRPAARHFGVRVNRHFNYAAGYVADGTIAEFASRHGLVEDYEGKHLLFDNTLPISSGRTTMPDGVVAVDLAASGGGYERERGFGAIRRLQRVWQEAHEKN